MDILDFSQAIKRAINGINKLNNFIFESEDVHYFLNELDKLILSDEADICLKMTRLTILFEGLYRHLAKTDLKNVLADVRGWRWINHFGTPTISFLLTYKLQIEQTRYLFDKFISFKELECKEPWIVIKESDFVADNINNVIINPGSIYHVVAPKTREITGAFTKTNNPLGGFTTTACDPISQEFIKHSVLSSKTGGKVLEIGAAFGAATLEAVANGATVFCNDIDPENLAVVRQRFLEFTHMPGESLTADSSKLILIPGELPNELIGLPEKYFDAILICRVLHFFTGSKIEDSLVLMYKLLSPGGKIYIVCETPFLKNWQSFIPEFNRRIENKVEWPGEITDPAEYESSGRASSLPKFVHWITKEVLERSLKKAGFSIENSIYINRRGQFPEDLLLPEYGKESVGAIGMV